MASTRKNNLLTDVQRSILSRYFDQGMTGKGQAHNDLIEQASAEAKVTKETVKNWIGSERKKRKAAASATSSDQDTAPSAKSVKSIPYLRAPTSYKTFVRSRSTKISVETFLW